MNAGSEGDEGRERERKKNISLLKKSIECLLAVLDAWIDVWKSTLYCKAHSEVAGSI